MLTCTCYENKKGGKSSRPPSEYMRLCPAKIKHCINTDKAQEALIAITRDAVPCVRSTGTQRPAVEHNGALATQSKAAWGGPEREKKN